MTGLILPAIDVIFCRGTSFDYGEDDGPATKASDSG